MIEIRAAKVSDAEGIARVHVDTWRHAYRDIVSADFLAGLSYENRSRAWSEWLAEGPPPFVYVAQSQTGEVAGFASGGREREGKYGLDGELYAIYVLPAYHRQGIGRRLIQTLAARLSAEAYGSMLVWVLADNPWRGFYEAMGGKFVAQKTIRVADDELLEVAYGWTDLESF